MLSWNGMGLASRASIDARLERSSLIKLLCFLAKFEFDEVADEKLILCARRCSPFLYFYRNQILAIDFSFAFFVANSDCAREKKCRGLHNLHTLK